MEICRGIEGGGGLQAHACTRFEISAGCAINLNVVWGDHLSPNQCNRLVAGSHNVVTSSQQYRI